MIGGVFYWILTKCNCAYFTYITINIPIDSMAYIPREKVMLGLQNFYTMINIVLFPANFLKFPSVTSSAIIKIQTTNLGITNSRVNQHTPTQQNSVKNWETIKNQFCLKKGKMQGKHLGCLWKAYHIASQDAFPGAFGVFSQWRALPTTSCAGFNDLLARITISS